MVLQGSFCVCTQPMRDDVTLLCRLSLAGRITQNDSCCMRPANEGWCYNVTSSLIGWAHTQNDPYGTSVIQILGKFCVSVISIPGHQFATNFCTCQTGAMPSKCQAISWTNDDQVHCCKYVSPGLNGLTHWCLGVAGPWDREMWHFQIPVKLLSGALNSARPCLWLVNIV